MVLMVMWVITLSLAAIRNQPYACHLVNTSASPTCWSGICAEQKRVSKTLFCTLHFLGSLYWTSFILSAAEEEEELKKSAVVNWYLKEIESEIDSEEELVNKKGLIEKVLHRLVHYVSPPSMPDVECCQCIPHLQTRCWHISMFVFLPGSYPYWAVPGRTKGLRISKHGGRSRPGRQPQLHPGGLVLSNFLCLNKFFNQNSHLSCCWTLRRNALEIHLSYCTDDSRAL